MEAATTKRTTLRLTAALGGVVLTLGLVATTLCLLVWPSDESAGDTPRDVAAKTPEPFDPLESYRLPLGNRGHLTPVTSSLPVAPALGAPSNVYSAPLAEAFVDEQRGADEITPIEPHSQAPAPLVDEPGGPLTIHNPAAFGPPEDDSVPPLPTAARPSIAAAPAPLNKPSNPAPPSTRWDGPPELDLSADSARPTQPAPDRSVIVPTRQAPKPELRVASVVQRPAPSSDSSDHQAMLQYTASTNDLSKRLSPEVQAGFQLGKSGAVYAARTKFVSVLRRIALAKDAEEGSSRHAEALAEALRTLEEADDFVPKGDALEAELDVAAIARSHGVRLVSADDAVAPHQAIARYSQHAAERLAEAAGDEPAGSMALYGLGKTYARLEAQGGDATAGSKSAVMYRAAIDTHAENYLAANELGVRLARAGRYEQASQVLRRAASQPTAIATVHANLAAIEERLGREQIASMAQQHSQMLAQRERAAGEVSRRHGVEWVAPGAFQQAAPRRGSAVAPPVAPNAAPMAGAPAPLPGNASYAAAPTPASTEEPGGWNGLVRMAKRATGWSSPSPTTGQPAPPQGAPYPHQSQHVVR